MRDELNVLYEYFAHHRITSKKKWFKKVIDQVEGPAKAIMKYQIRTQIGDTQQLTEAYEDRDEAYWKTQWSRFENAIKVRAGLDPLTDMHVVLKEYEAVELTAKWDPTAAATFLDEYLKVRGDMIVHGQIDPVGPDLREIETFKKKIEGSARDIITTFVYLPGGEHDPPELDPVYPTAPLKGLRMLETFAGNPDKAGGMLSKTWERAGGTTEVRDLLISPEHDYHNDEKFWQAEFRKPRDVYAHAPECTTFSSAHTTPVIRGKDWPEGDENIELMNLMHANLILHIKMKF